MNPRPKVLLAKRLHAYSHSRSPRRENIHASRSECDKKRDWLVLDLASVLGPHTETSLQYDVLPQPAGKAAEDGNLTN